jgi:hypothetical protein
MEGGRQADVAKGILRSKNIPYVVAAPLLIQARGGTPCDGLVMFCPDEMSIRLRMQSC